MEDSFYENSLDMSAGSNVSGDHDRSNVSNEIASNDSAEMNSSVNTTAEIKISRKGFPECVRKNTSNPSTSDVKYPIINTTNNTSTTYAEYVNTVMLAQRYFHSEDTLLGFEARDNGMSSRDYVSDEIELCMSNDSNGIFRYNFASISHNCNFTMFFRDVPVRDSVKNNSEGEPVSVNLDGLYRDMQKLLITFAKYNLRRKFQSELFIHYPSMDLIFNSLHMAYRINRNTTEGYTCDILITCPALHTNVHSIIEFIKSAVDILKSKSGSEEMPVLENSRSILSKYIEHADIKNYYELMPVPYCIYDEYKYPLIPYIKRESIPETGNLEIISYMEQLMLNEELYAWDYNSDRYDYYCLHKVNTRNVMCLKGIIEKSCVRRDM